MDFIGVSQLSNILVYKARNDESSNTSTNLQTSLELCENAEAYEILAMNYEDLISSEFICPDIYNNIVYYYEKALELEPSNCRILYNYAHFWRSIGNIDNKLKYWRLAAKENDIPSILRLAAYHYDKGEKIIWVKYCLMGELYNCDDEEYAGVHMYDILDKYVVKNIFELHMYLHSNLAQLLLKPLMEDSKKYAEYHISKLRNNHVLCSLNNKITLFTRLNNVHDCAICYEDKLNISLDCGHELCVDCYKSIYKHNSTCHICRCVI